jgi:hypothetical protein
VEPGFIASLAGRDIERFVKQHTNADGQWVINEAPLGKVQTGQRRSALAGIAFFFFNEQARTAWSLFQATVSFIDHGRIQRVAGGIGTPEEKRFESVVFGDGAKAKHNAWRAAQAVAK